jgi:hypothetical protein
MKVERIGMRDNPQFGPGYGRVVPSAVHDIKEKDSENDLKAKSILAHDGCV